MLVVGAGGGVGGYAVQLAAMRGATVIATARPGDEARLRELGAAETVDFTAADVASTVRDRHPEGIDGLIDLVSYSPDQMAPLVALVRDGGAIASPLGAAGAPGRDLVATNVMADALDPAVLSELAALAGAGDLRIPVEAVFPLEEPPRPSTRSRAASAGRSCSPSPPAEPLNLRRLRADGEAQCASSRQAST